MSHAVRAHSVLSASGSSIWMNCTMSPVLSRGAERRSSKYADEGTRAHELAERFLRGEPQDGENEAMKEALKPFLDHVQQLMDKTSIWKIEHRVDLSPLWDGLPPEDLFGTADFVAVLPGGDLHVVDLKYGRGVPVEVKDNTQLLYYALGVWLALKDATPIQSVTMTIVQPRAPHEDGPIRSWSIPVLDLIQWGYDVLKPTVEKICEGDKDELVLQEGKHCRWCPAASAGCPEKGKTRTKQAQQEFDDLPEG
jgi:hypothetical protein